MKVSTSFTVGATSLLLLMGRTMEKPVAWSMNTPLPAWAFCVVFNPECSVIDAVEEV